MSYQNCNKIIIYKILNNKVKNIARQNQIKILFPMKMKKFPRQIQQEIVCQIKRAIYETV